MLRRIFVVFGVAIALLLVTFGLLGGYALRKAMGSLREGQAQAEAEQKAAASKVMADHRRWAADPLFAPRDGGDASGALSDYVGWEKLPARKPMPAAIVAGLADAGAGWPASELDVSEVDLSVFASLEGAAWWDIEGPTSPLHDAPYKGMEEPSLNYRDLNMLAKARLLRGLATKEMGPALKDVHELVRLCLTTESLIGNMVGVGLMEIERKGAAEATARGLDLGGFQVPTEEDRRSLKAALWAAPHSTSLLSPDEPLDPAFPLIGRCAALNELAVALYIRPYATTVLENRYQTFTKMLAASDCRLRRLRRAWAGSGEGELPLNGQAFCQASGGSGGVVCDAPDFAVKLPFVRPAIGAVLASTATPDWLKFYRPGGAP